MKRRGILLILVCTVILMSSNVVMAVQTSNNKVDYLVENGLVKGDQRGLRLKESISRAEVSAMIVRVLDLEEVAEGLKLIPSPFTDVDIKHWANGYINTISGRGIVSGYPDNSFKPESNIIYTEVVAILVRAIGGLNEIEMKTAVWPTTYLAKGIELGILDDVELVNYTESAQREKVFEMVYNTINIKEPEKEKELGIKVDDNIKRELSVSEINDYLTKDYGTLNTIIGTEKLIFEINKNDDMYTRFDYNIEIKFPINRYEKIFGSNTYSIEEKEILRKQIKDHQKNIADALIDLLPDKRLSGGYYERWYEYPNLKIGLKQSSINVWRNYVWTTSEGATKNYYEKEDAIVVGNTYYLSELVDFMWDKFFGIDHEFKF